MRPPDDLPPPGERLAALADLARDAAPAPSELALRRGLLAVAARRQAAARRRRGLLVAAAAAAILAAPVAYLAGRASGGLTVAPEAARIDGEGIVRPVGQGPARLAFSDGSRVELAPATLGRLERLDRRGGRVAFDDGAADVQIAPRADRRWTIRAGPYEILVKGTAFRVAWSGARRRFSLAMQRGEVEVRGPFAGAGLRVSGRQTLAIDEGRGAVSFDDPARPAPSAPPPPREAPATGGAPREAPGIPAAPPPRRRVERAGAPPPRLRELLVRGQVEAVVEAAHRQGVARALATAELPDLVALGDAARYLRRDDLARRALLATRARFPRAPEARDAAFLLGRLEEGGAKDANGAAVALAWYDRYLAGGEAGDYAAEALGRKMVLLDRLEGRPRARAAAAAYLARFPHGSYASAARALLAGP